MSVKHDIARLRSEMARRPKLKTADPLDSMTPDELDAELAELDAELLELGMTPEEIGVESHHSSVDYWISKGYSPENAKTLASTL